MKNQPIIMEDYFSPGFITKPAIHIGSQAVKFFWGNASEQAWEGFHLAATSKNDLAVVRNFDPEYITYWKTLMDNPYIINIKSRKNLGNYLTEVVLDDKKIISEIKKNHTPGSSLMIFIPTELEKKLAEAIGVPLHGSPEISAQFGTKSGIRRLAAEASIPMTPGFICSTLPEVRQAISILAKSFKTLIVKHDFSLSGYFSKKIDRNKIGSVRKLLNEISGGHFTEGADIVVVEGWVKAKASLCAQIEITEGKDPIICAGWQQMIDDDGISYIGAGPFMLSNKALNSFIEETKRLAVALQEKGAIGSFGPDFLVVDDDEENIEADTCVLIELNARVPYTAFPLQIIKNIRGKIGNGFLSQHIKLPKKTTFSQIKKLLEKENLLITEKNSHATGIIPYNMGLLPWNLFDIVAMADTWDETLDIIKKIRKIFPKFE